MPPLKLVFMWPVKPPFSTPASWLAPWGQCFLYSPPGGTTSYAGYLGAHLWGSQAFCLLTTRDETWKHKQRNSTWTVNHLGGGCVKGKGRKIFTVIHISEMKPLETIVVSIVWLEDTLFQHKTLQWRFRPPRDRYPETKWKMSENMKKARSTEKRTVNIWSNGK